MIEITIQVTLLILRLALPFSSHSSGKNSGHILEEVSIIRVQLKIEKKEKKKNPDDFSDLLPFVLLIRKCK